MTVTARVFTGIAVSHQNITDNGTGDFEAAATLAPAVFQSGTGSGQVSSEFCEERSLAASASETLDLSGGGLLDGLGGALTFTKVQAVEIVADPGNGSNIVVGAAGSNPFLGPMGGTAPTVTLPPGGRLLWCHPGAGWPVTNGSNDSLKIANGDSVNAAKYKIKIIG